MSDIDVNESYSDDNTDKNNGNVLQCSIIEWVLCTF